MLKIEPIRRADWTALPFDGCENVYVQMLIKQNHLGLAMLKFDKNGRIHEHPADIDIDVVCLEGEGMVRVGTEESLFKAGETVRWPKGIPHCLWTENSEMKTLMVEHYSS